MTIKFNAFKSIKQALIGTNIVFPAVYILFSAEVCSRGIPKNQPSSQISRTAPVSLADKPIGQLEELEDADPNRYALDLFHRDQSVIPVQIRKPVVSNDLVALQKKSSAHADKVAELLLSNQPQVEDVSPKQYLETMVIDPSNRPNEHMDGPDQTDGPATIQQDPPLNFKPFSAANQTSGTDPEIIDKEKKHQQYTLYMLQEDYSPTIHFKTPCSKSRMNAIRWRSPDQYIVELRHFFIKASLEALEGAYGYRKVDAVKWFFKQPVQDIVKQYDRSILDLVIKEVEENQEGYKKIVGLEKNQKKYSIVVLVEELKTLMGESIK